MWVCLQFKHRIRKWLFFGLMFVADFPHDGWKVPYLCSELLHKSLLKEQFFWNLLASALHRLLDPVSQANREQHRNFRWLVSASAPACYVSVRPCTFSDMSWIEGCVHPLSSDSHHLLRWVLIGSCSISPLNSIADGHWRASALAGKRGESPELSWKHGEGQDRNHGTWKQ